MNTPDVKANTEDDALAIPDIFKRKKGEKPKSSVTSKPKAKPLPAKANGKAKTAAKAPVSAPVSAEPEPAKARAPAKAKSAPAASKTAKPKAKATAKAKASDPTAVVVLHKATVKAKVAAKPKAKAAEKPKPVKKQAVKTKTPGSGVKLDSFGFKIGTNTSKSATMYARKSGATTEEMCEVFSGAQLNVLKQAEERGHTVRREKTTRKDGRSATRYYLSL